MRLAVLKFFFFTPAPVSGDITGTGTLEISGPELAGVGVTEVEEFAPIAFAPLRRRQQITGQGSISIQRPDHFGAGRVRIVGVARAELTFELRGTGALHFRGAGAVASEVSIEASGTVDPYARARRQEHELLELEDGKTLVAA